ncbi:phage tail protein [Jeongeupia chitinilytica]|uniref:phage tail protein n=1 Tax=Jeongeupia chitinilytica TaxID=1041641 RepID=UPI00227D8309|nr:phage tail protein [Jeongeupia chitinilytica]
MTDFTWSPQYGAQLDKTPRTRSVQFGDGYEQRRNDGLNPILQSWTLGFQRSKPDIQQIDDFLTDKAGITSFSWLDLDDKPVRVKCAKWSVVEVDRNIARLMAVFEQVFEP